MKKNNHFPRRLLMASVGLGLILIMFSTSCSKKNDNKPDKPKDKIIKFESNAKLSSSSVVSNATGSLKAQFDTAAGKLSYTFTWQNLTGVIGGFHIHKGDGAVIINFKDAGYSTATSGTFTDSSVLTEDNWIQDLKAGKLYGQIHTAQYPAGELIFPFTIKSNPGSNNGSGDGGYDGY